MMRSRLQPQAGARSACRAAAVRGLPARLASTARSGARDGSSLGLITEVERFNKESALEESLTAPASWYTEPDFLRLEECEPAGPFSSLPNRVAITHRERRPRAGRVAQGCGVRVGLDARGPHR